jgi:hypothetical protein
MVDMDGLTNAAVLKREVQNINTALGMLDNNEGHIVAVVVAPLGEDVSGEGIFPGSVLLRTDKIEFQAVWVNGLKNQLRTTAAAVRDELRKMGVTGVPTT